MTSVCSLVTSQMDLTSDHLDDRSDSGYDETEDVAVELSRLAAKNLTSRWSHGHSITMFNVGRRPIDGKKPDSSGLAQDSPVLRLTWDNFQLARRLVCESHAVFFNTQALRRNPQRRISDLLRASQQYRASIKVLFENADASLLQDELANHELRAYETIEMIWHAAELMLFTRSPVLPGLLDWARTHFSPHLDDSFKSLCHEAAESEHPESLYVHEHVEYWPSIFAYAVRGMTLQVVQLLALHPLSSATTSDNDNAFAVLIALVESMPMVTADVTETQFATRWKLWKDDVASALSRKDLFVNRPPQLRTLFLILSGDAESLASSSNDWAILLVALVLYTQPTAKPHELKSLVHSLPTLLDARAKTPMQHTRVLAYSERIANLSDAVDALMQAIFECETEMIIHGVLDYNNTWFSAHFLDLLSLCDPTPFEQLPQMSCTLHENAFLEYVTSLLTQRLPVRLLADYLGCCPQFGRDYLVHVIARQPISTEREACKLLSLCQTFQLQSTHAAHSIIQSAVSQRARTGRLASALAWATGTQAKQLANALLHSVYLPLTQLDSSLAQRLKLRSTLNYQSQTTTTVQQHKRRLQLVVDALASSSHLVDSAVEFVQIYAQVLQSYDEGDLQETLVLLGRSLGSELAPKRFWLPILLDCTAILELLQETVRTTTTAPVFSASEIYDLMHCLEEASFLLKEGDDPTNSVSNDNASGLSRAEQDDAMANIRLTLTHQLSEAILCGH